MTKRSSFHLAVRPEHDIRVGGSLSLIVVALAACSGVDEPGSRACELPNVLRYEKPGCGDLASPVCGSPQSDAHLTYACGCDGEIVLGGDYYREPWQSPGICPGACYTPTRNLEAAVSLSGLVHGCACDSGTDATACVQIFGHYRPMACVDGTWALDNTGAPCTPRDGGVDGEPADPGLDGKPADTGCLPPRSIIYTTPGCGAEAIPRCEVPNGDGCSMPVCLCDGVTNSGDGCGFSHEPFLYHGWCKRDAAPAVDVSTSVDVSSDAPPG